MVIKNMPRVRSQDSLKICFGMSSSVIAQFYICKQKGIPCDHLTENKEISPLAMVGWANKNSEDALGGRDSDHSNLHFWGRGGQALQYLASEPNNEVLPESCYSLDQLANEYGLYNGEEIDRTLEDIENQYNNKNNTEAGFCETCLIEDLQNKLKVKTDAQDIKNSLVIDPFGQFLHSAFFASCDKNPLGFEPPPKHDTFPIHKTASYRETMTKIKEILGKGYPLVLDGVCGSVQDGKCVGHSVAINGYRRICKTDGTCRESLKIQNSWGEDWQKENDDGWLDAKTLLGEEPIQEFALSWWLPKT